MNLVYLFSSLMAACVIIFSLTGCVPTLGSDFIGTPPLKHDAFIDLNTVPDQAEAQRPRRLPKENEQKAHQKDQEDLEQKRLALQAAGEKLRQKALSDQKENKDDRKSRS